MVKDAFVCKPWVAMAVVNALFHISWVSTLAVCQTYQIVWLGMTTNERMNLGRYTHFRKRDKHKGGGSFDSPFSRGHWNNLVDFLGKTAAFTTTPIALISVKVLLRLSFLPASSSRSTDGQSWGWGYKLQNCRISCG